MKILLQDEAWEDLEEGVEALLDEWHVHEGEVVAQGQLIASAMVAKSSFDVLTPAAGTIRKLLVAAQNNFTRSQVLAELEEA